MKKIYSAFLKTLLLPGLLYPCSVLHAQEVFPKGAKWHYNFTAWAIDGYEVAICTGDTLIGGEVYRSIYRERYYHRSSFPGVGDHHSIYETRYIRQTNDSVFSWLNGAHTFLYTFNAKPGDKWRLEGDQAICGANKYDSLLVDSVGTEVINGKPVRYILPSYSHGMNWYYTGRIYEYFGGTSYFLPSPGPHCNSDPDEAAPLRCYSDNHFGEVKFTTLNCDYVSGITDQDGSRTRLAHYLTQDNTLRILDPKVQLIEVRSALGQLLLQIKNPSEILDLSSLPVGIHIITAKTGERTELYKIIVD